MVIHIHEEKTCTHTHTQDKTILKEIKLGIIYMSMVPKLGRMSEVYRTLCYTVNERPAWATGDPVSNKVTNLRLGIELSGRLLA